MNRYAILLATPSENSPTPNVCDDLAMFYSFLRSNCGGAWQENEILRHENPSMAQILATVRAAKNADYSLVFLAGYGEKVKAGLPWAEMRIALDCGETITERELNPGTPRCTLIFSCASRTSAQDPNPPPDTSASFPRNEKPSSEFRTLYYERLMQAEGGVARIYSTSISDPAAGTKFFTQSLITTANRWALINKGMLHLGEAVALANDAMKKTNNSHRAEYLGGRRLRHFPFLVQP